jgi:hypothetical protein
MSSILARSARQAPTEEDRRRVEDHGQAQEELPELVAHPERRRRRDPNSHSPIGDQTAIRTAKTSATRKRLRMSRTIVAPGQPDRWSLNQWLKVLIVAGWDHR